MDKSAIIRGAIMAMNVENNVKTELFKYLDDLEDNDLFLCALQENGVDDWVWYGEAQETYREYKEEE